MPSVSIVKKEVGVAIAGERICMRSAVWDLHIHSNQCTKPDKELAKLSVSEYVDRLLEVIEPYSDLQMISFTDHNSMSLELYREFYGRNSRFVLLPGVEIDVSIDGNKPSKHLVVYFDCIADSSKLESVISAVNGLKVDGDAVSDKNPIALQDLLEELLKIRVRFVVSPHAFKQGKRGIDDEWHPMSPEDRDVDRFLDQFFCFWETSGASSTARAIEFLKMVDRGDRESIVAFSDSKEFSKLDGYLKNPHQYFNALPNFNGLQMVGTEVSRIVKAQTAVPEGQSGRYIGSMSLGGSVIAFSPRLNAIIGGRGSGKSVLLDGMAAAMGSDASAKRLNDKQRSAFIRSLGVKVGNMRGAAISDGAFSFDYFNQSYISMLFQKTGSEFNDALEEYFSDAFSSVPMIDAAAIKAENDQVFAEQLQEQVAPKADNLVDLVGTYVFDRDEKLTVALKVADKKKVEPSLKGFSYEVARTKMHNAIWGAVPAFMKEDKSFRRLAAEFEESFLNVAFRHRADYLDADWLTNDLVDKYRKKKSSLNERQKSRSAIEILFKNAFEKETVDIKNRVAVVNSYISVQQAFKSVYEQHLDIDGEQAKAFRFTRELHCQNPIDYLIECLEDALRNSAGGGKCCYDNLPEYIDSFCFGGAEYKSGRSAEGLYQKLKDFGLRYEERPSISYLDDDDSYRNIAEKSPGTRTNVLLEYIVYKQTGVPLLIDQPEDNVDNRTIYSQIRRWFMDMKRNRQVIVVTHDANIVVNADAENVILASQLPSGEFKYEYGALESGDMLEKASEILDGGKDAVRRRLLKYGY